MELSSTEVTPPMRSTQRSFCESPDDAGPEIWKLRSMPELDRVAAGRICPLLEKACTVRSTVSDPGAVERGKGEPDALAVGAVRAARAVLTNSVGDLLSTERPMGQPSLSGGRTRFALLAGPDGAAKASMGAERRARAVPDEGATRESGAWGPPEDTGSLLLAPIGRIRLAGRWGKDKKPGAGSLRASVALFGECESLCLRVA